MNFIVFFLSFLLCVIDNFVRSSENEPVTPDKYRKLKLTGEEGVLTAKKTGKLSTLKSADDLGFLKSTTNDKLVTEDTTESLSFGDLGISLPSEYANETIVKDHHTYYNSTFYSNPVKAQEFWIDLDKMPHEHVITHKMLSDSHRQASTVDLSFDFPFYGSYLRNLTIATGGFLYMGDYLHNWIAATQYIAPLMANFDTTLSDNSTIKYADNGTAFVVQWDQVFIQDKIEDGHFTFQASLFKNGDICFAYKEVPVPITEISDEKHPVKVGISDAYILERAVFFVRRKTIYEYHRIDMMQKLIGNDTAIYFTALPTCLDNRDCQSCQAADKHLECVWCQTVERCSDGIDRQRQSWVVNGCTIQSSKTCSAEETSEEMEFPSTHYYVTESSSVTSSPPSKTYPTYPKTGHGNDVTEDYGLENDASRKGDLEIKERFVQGEMETRSGGTSITTGAIIAIIVFITILLGVGMWLFYAYRFPQSSSGQFLIKYRPSQWSVKPEGSSTTNDSFHM